MKANDFLLTTEAARVLQRSADTVRRYERAGLLKATKTPSGVRVFLREDVERLAEKLRQGAHHDR